MTRPRRSRSSGRQLGYLSPQPRQGCLCVRLLLGFAPGACSFLTDLQTQQPALPEAQVRWWVRYHLATGCPACRQQVQTAGVGTDGGAALLAALAPVPVPAGLRKRLREQVRTRATVLAALPFATEEATMNRPQQRPLRLLSLSRNDKSKRSRSVAVLAGATVLLLSAVLALLGLVPRQERPAPPSLPSVRVSVQTSDRQPEAGATVFQLDRAALPTLAATSPTPGATAAGASAVASDAGITPRTTATSQVPAAPSDATVVILNSRPMPITSNAGEAAATPPRTVTPQSRAPSMLPTATADAAVVMLNPGPVAGSGSAAPAAPADLPSPPQPPTPPPPRLVASGEVVTFTRSETVKTVSLRNAGEGDIGWRAETRQPWIVVSPAAGTLTDTATLQIRVNRELVPRGLQQGSVSINSTAGTIIVTVVSE